MKEKIRDLQNRRLFSETSAEVLADVRQKSRAYIFFIKLIERQVGEIKALARRFEGFMFFQKIALQETRWLYFIILFSQFVHIFNLNFGLILTKNEVATRLFLGGYFSVISYLFFNSLIFHKKTRKMLVFATSAAAFTLFQKATEDLLLAIFGNVHALNSVVFSAAGMLLILFSILISKIALKHPKKFFWLVKNSQKKWCDDFKREAQKTIEEGDDIREKELKEYIERHARNRYSDIYELLSSKEEALEKEAEEAMKFEVKVVDSIPTPNKKLEVPIYIGQAADGTNVEVDFIDLPHMKIGGTTKSGKSNYENVLINQLLNLPIDLYLVDPEEVEFCDYEGYEGVKVGYSVEDALLFANELIREMETRIGVFKTKKNQNGGTCKKIEEYNFAAKNKMRRKMFIFDEYKDFINNEELMNSISILARKGRKYGVHVIVATQTCSKKVISAEIKNNITCSLAFRVADRIASDQLGVVGAEKISKADKGVAIFKTSGDEQIVVKTPLFKGIQTSRRRVGAGDDDEDVLDLSPETPETPETPEEAVLGFLKENKGKKYSLDDLFSGGFNLDVTKKALSKMLISKGVKTQRAAAGNKYWFDL